MGFWEYPAKGISTPSERLMNELLEAQKIGKDVAHPDLLRMEAAKIKERLSEDHFPGHAAWLDWPWKLHKKQEKGPKNEKIVELYNLVEDPNESSDASSDHQDRVESMRAALEAWQTSVIRSLNGEDYP